MLVDAATPQRPIPVCTGHTVKDTNPAGDRYRKIRIHENKRFPQQSLNRPDGSGLNPVVDDGGNAFPMTHKGFQAGAPPALPDDPADNKTLKSPIPYSRNAR